MYYYYYYMQELDTGLAVWQSVGFFSKWPFLVLQQIKKPIGSKKAFFPLTIIRKYT